MNVTITFLRENETEIVETRVTREFMTGAEVRRFARNRAIKLKATMITATDNGAKIEIPLFTS